MKCSVERLIEALIATEMARERKAMEDRAAAELQQLEPPGARKYAGRRP